MGAEIGKGPVTTFVVRVLCKVGSECPEELGEIDVESFLQVQEILDEVAYEDTSARMYRSILGSIQLPSGKKAYRISSVEGIVVRVTNVCGVNIEVALDNNSGVTTELK